ncbi:ribonuclease H-like domain-containing protein [Tanacetum coccineum]
MFQIYYSLMVRSFPEKPLNDIVDGLRSYLLPMTVIMITISDDGMKELLEMFSSQVFKLSLTDGFLNFLFEVPKCIGIVLVIIVKLEKLSFTISVVVGKWVRLVLGMGEHYGCFCLPPISALEMDNHQKDKNKAGNGQNRARNGKLDVKNAFLHGDLSETVYMHQPPSFWDPEHSDYVCLLQRSLYGLKQAHHAWFQRFAAYITTVGFTPSLFIYRQGDDTTFLLLYVDDIRKYAMEILERAYMVGCNSSRTPVDTESKLGDGGTPVVDPTLYRSLAGSLQYLTFTRPAITYAVQQGTLDYGLQLFSSTTDSLIAYSDADWAGCPTTRRSTSGYCVFLGNNLLSWSSKRQPTLSHSSAEAEYRGVANVVAETCWIRNLLRKLHTPLSSATIVYCDNVSDVYLSSNPVQHQRTKHIEIDIHFVRDLVATGQVRVLHVPSRFRYADIFTKGLPSALFDEFRDSLSVRCTPDPTAGEC